MFKIVDLASVNKFSARVAPAYSLHNTSKEPERGIYTLWVDWVQHSSLVDLYVEHYRGQFEEIVSTATLVCGTAEEDAVSTVPTVSMWS